MSQLTNHAENKLADFARGQGLSLPDSWWIALGSAASDSSFTEISGTGYARVEVPRSLTDWAGTQAAGSTVASNGTSHTTSNNAEIDFGTAGSAWGDVTHVGLFNGEDSDSVCWIYLPLEVPLDVGSSDPVSIAASALTLAIGLAGGMSDYLSNKLIDLIFRDQAYSWPLSVYLTLYTAAPSNAGGGTEVSGGSYARVAIGSSYAALSGTQSAGSTDESTGTGGRISNNTTKSFPAPTADWGTVSWCGLKDAATVGNLMWWKPLTAPKTIPSGVSAPSFPVNTVGITWA